MEVWGHLWAQPAIEKQQELTPGVVQVFLYSLTEERLSTSHPALRPQLRLVQNPGGKERKEEVTTCPWASRHPPVLPARPLPFSFLSVESWPRRPLGLRD